MNICVLHAIVLNNSRLIAGIKEEMQRIVDLRHMYNVLAMQSDENPAGSNPRRVWRKNEV